MTKKDKWSLEYIECDGVRVPSDWTVEQLREALAKRKIRFFNEQEVIGVFGKAVLLKKELENSIEKLQNEKALLLLDITKIQNERNAKVRR